MTTPKDSLSLWQNLSELYQRKKESFDFYYLVLIWNVLLFAFLAGISNTFMGKSFDCEIHTGTSGGRYQTQGVKIKNKLEAHGRIRPHVYPSDGDVENFNKLRERWSGHSVVFNTTGITQLLLKRQEGDQQYSNDSVAVVLPMGGQSAWYIFKQKSEKLKDLRTLGDIWKWSAGHPRDTLRVYLGTEKSGSFLLAKEVLEMKGKTLEQLPFDYEGFQHYRFKDAASHLCADDLDLVFLYGDYRMPVLDTLRNCDEVISVQWNPGRQQGSLKDVVRQLSDKIGGDFFRECSIPNRRMHSIGSQSILLTQANQSPYFVFELLRELDKENTEFGQNIAAMRKAVDKERYDGIPLHEGARRYFFERSFWGALYFFQRNMTWVFLPLFFLLFFIQIRLLLRLSYYQKVSSGENISAQPAFKISNLQVAALILVMTALALFINYLG